MQVHTALSCQLSYVLFIWLFIVCRCEYVNVRVCVFVRAGGHGGARDGNQLFSPFMQQLIEYHCWQVLKYNPK